MAREPAMVFVFVWSVDPPGWLNRGVETVWLVRSRVSVGSSLLLWGWSGAPLREQRRPAVGRRYFVALMFVVM